MKRLLRFLGHFLATLLIAMCIIAFFAISFMVLAGTLIWWYVLIPFFTVVLFFALLTFDSQK
jgi:hypothetical protein